MSAKAWRSAVLLGAVCLLFWVWLIRAASAQELFPPGCIVDWDRVAGARGYRLEVNGTVTDVGNADSKADCKALGIEGGAYEVRVQAYNAQQSSPWSPAVSFSVGRLAAPKNLRIIYNKD